MSVNTKFSNDLDDLDLESGLMMTSLSSPISLVDPDIDPPLLIPEVPEPNRDPLLEPPISIDDLVDLVKGLPDLTLDKASNHYYVLGNLAKRDKEVFYSYAKRIENVKLESQLDPLSPQVFTRLGQLQDPDGHLLPSLRHIHISSNLYLDYLDLFLSPSLRTVEISAASASTDHINITSFLDAAVKMSPDVETFILIDPLQFSGNLVATFGRFKRLELIDVAESALDAILRTIGSLGHNIEELVIKEHSGRLFPPGEGTREPPSLVQTPGLGNGMGVMRLVPVWTRPGTGDTSSERSSDTQSRSSFSTLRSIDITGTSDLIKKVVDACITYPGLSDITLTFTTNTPRVIEVEAKKKKKLIEKKKPATKRVAKAIYSADVILDNIVKYCNTLVSFTIKAATGKTASLREDLFRDLLLHPTLRHLEIINFKISFLEGTLSELHSQKCSTGTVESLRLPAAPGLIIPFETLQQIVEACPKLTSLRCAVDSTSLVPEVILPISHGLQDLTVFSDNTGNLDLQHGLRVAAFIDSAFPNLEKMSVDVDETRSEYGHGRDWLQVFELVKSLKAARARERRRLGVSVIGR